MIYALTGKILLSEATQAVIDVAGVAYRMRVPVHVAEHLAEAREAVTVYTTQRVADDQIRLFGFATVAERDLFEALIEISGVGPATALGLLSGLKPEEIAAAIEDKDAGILRRVKGIGQKTAERIIIDMAGRIPDMAAARAASAKSPSQDAYLALLSLGYKDKVARTAVDRAQEELGKGAATADLVRAALRFT